jgi:2-haloacid dehalogenase
MPAQTIKALTFDTGGTILDWHTGIRTTLAELGAAHGIDADWAAITNEFRRRSLKSMLNHGEHAPATLNFDDVHRNTMDAVAADFGLDAFTAEERRRVWWDTIHNLQCWPDFPAVLPKLRERYFCVSFTILSFRIIMDTARRNDLSWDAVISCEAIGKYKVLPESYAGCARFLQLEPAECCMVACHNFDLDAAKAGGFKTAFVRRPDEWGSEGPPDPQPHAHHDFVIDGFGELAAALGVEV